MTIRELYSWAVENKVEDYDCIIFHRDYTGKYIEFDQPEPEVIPCPKQNKFLTRKVVSL